jgi:hypothetical protein
MQKGDVAWLSNKMAILIFAVAIFGALFVFFGAQVDFQEIDDLNNQAEALARLAESVCASPYSATAVFQTTAEAVEAGSQAGAHYVSLSKAGKSASEAVHCPLQAGTIAVTGPLTLTKQGAEVVIS